MINNINENDFRGVDLNLMVTLMVLLRERSVSRAAERLHLGQPAVSGALARLRGLFDDELLVRTGSAMLPTPRALELERSMGQALYDMHLALFQPPSFDPLTVARTVTIGMPDWIDTWLLPPLLAALSHKAPHVRVRVLETDPYTVSDMLAKEEIELAIGAFDQGPPWQRRAGLASMAFRCVGRPDVIGRGGKMTLAEYTGLSHLLVSHRGAFEGRVDKALATLGLSRNVVYTSPHFSSLPRVLQRVDAVAAVPGGLAPIWENDFGLLSAAIPLNLPTIEIALVWHATRDKDVFVQWVCGIVKDLVPGLAADSFDTELKLSVENVQK